MLYYFKKGKNEIDKNKQTNKKACAVYGEDTVTD